MVLTRHPLEGPPQVQCFGLERVGGQSLGVRFVDESASVDVILCLERLESKDEGLVSVSGILRQRGNGP